MIFSKKIFSRIQKDFSESLSQKTLVKNQFLPVHKDSNFKGVPAADDHNFRRISFSSCATDGTQSKKNSEFLKETRYRQDVESYADAPLLRSAPQRLTPPLPALTQNKNPSVDFYSERENSVHLKANRIFSLPLLAASLRRNFAAVLLAFAFVPAFAAQKTLVLGGENGWKNISEMDGIALGKGQFGYDAIVLSTAAQNADASTDMLVTFDNGNFSDKAGNYKILENSLVSVSDSVKGDGAALSRGNGKGLTLRGKDGSLFGSEGNSGSFMIEFWLCPAIAENGETVFSWRSSLNYNNYAEYQMISAIMSKNHLVWTFNNLFFGFKNEKVILQGISNIVPQKWSRHTVSFDEENGILEYLVDGRTEDLVYVTKNGHESGEVCNPVLGKKASLEFCGAYTGKIDNIRINRYSYGKELADVFTTGNEKYKIDGGKFVTEPILVSHSAVMKKIDALMSVPSQTDVKFYVRSGDNCFGWTDSYPEWKEIVPGEDISDVSGLYFQVSAELLPDGGAEKTPAITELAIKYDEQDEPLPPFSVLANAGDGSVTLSWSYSVDDSAGGYLVYYGNRPGEYLGRTAVEGASPVKAGNQSSITLSGLQNGKIYYFAVAAYSKIDGRIIGTLSKEVYARPSSRLAKK